MKRWMALVAVAVGAIAGVGAQQAAPAIFGFTSATAAGQHELERRFLALPSADRARDYHRYLTDEPHVAGTDRNKHLAEWMRDRWKEYGLDTVEIRRARSAAALPHRDDVDDGHVGVAVYRGSRAGRSGHAEAAAALQRLLEIRGSRGASDLCGQWESRQLRLARVAGHRRARQDRARPLLRAVQLSRVQGADGRAARRGRHARLLGSGRGRRRQGRGLPGRPVGQREPHTVAAAFPTTSWCRAIRSRPAGRRCRAHGASRPARPRRCRRSSARRCRRATRACCCRRWAGPTRRRPGRAGSVSRTASARERRPVKLRVMADDKVRAIQTVIGTIRGQRAPGRGGDPRQPPRRVAVRRRGPVKRHRVR